jgi:hypothetical protein
MKAEGRVIVPEIEGLGLRVTLLHVLGEDVVE